MAEIPSEIASSAAQSGIQTREATRDREARQATQANAADRRAHAVNQADTTVETTDNDTQVFTDAEGAGSQGRNFEEENTPPDEDSTESRDGGIIQDDQGNLHLDLEA